MNVSEARRSHTCRSPQEPNDEGALQQWRLAAFYEPPETKSTLPSPSPVTGDGDGDGRLGMVSLCNLSCDPVSSHRVLHLQHALKTDTSEAVVHFPPSQDNKRNLNVLQL